MFRQIMLLSEVHWLRALTLTESIKVTQISSIYPQALIATSPAAHSRTTGGISGLRSSGRTISTASSAAMPWRRDPALRNAQVRIVPSPSGNTPFPEHHKREKESKGRSQIYCKRLGLLYSDRLKWAFVYTRVWLVIPQQSCSTSDVFWRTAAASLH